MLAPEEIFEPSASKLRSRSELTPTEKRALHNKQKKVQKKARDSLERHVEKFGKAAKRGGKSVRTQKEEALKSIVRTGKGVTVVGKTNSGKTKKSRSKVA